ncbi:MAG: T9SS type A sorting domain-containing protein [Bacteroidia bacterium]|nr:T9SS type A sorting domain-containing protein [Bacteroidia bacterium]
MRNAFIIITLLLAVSSNAQTGFDVTYGPVTRFARGIEVANNNGFMVCANVDLPWMHTQLMRIDATGDTLWTRTFGDDSTQYKTYDMVRSRDGGYILSGDYQQQSTFPNMDSYVMKVDSLGFVVWFNKFGRSTNQNGGKDFANGIDNLSDGGCVSVGWAKHAFSPSDNVINLSGWEGYVTTFDSLGQELESRTLLFYFEPDTYMIYGAEMPVDVKVIGNRIFTADNYGSQISSFASGRIVALNYALDTIFSFLLGQGDMVEGLGVTADDHLLIVSDSSLIKLDTLGNVVWRYNCVLHSATAVREFPGGNIVVLEGCSGDWLHRDALLSNTLNSGQKVIFHSFTSNGTPTFSDTVYYSNTASFGAGDFELTQDSLITLAGAMGSRIWIYQFRDSLGPFSVSIGENCTSESPVLYPNPALDEIHISGSSVHYSYQLLTLDGELTGVDGITIDTIDLGQLSAGVYLLYLSDDNGVNSVFRLVKL